MRRSIATLALATWLSVTPLTTWSKDEAATDPAKKAESDSAVQEAVPASSVTHHQVTIDGKVVKYTATTGWYILKDPEDKPIARFGYTAYTADGVKNPSQRPVTFAFNGGPGSSSIWLHMGIMGPRRVVVNDGGYAPPPPSQVVDNPYSPLDVTDVVMIDPVGTGYSKPLGEAKPADFHGVDEDLKSVAQFIKRYVSENGRWGSPKYVLGESYGGMRGAGLAYYLQANMGMNLNGLVLVSPFLNAATGIDGEGMDLGHVTYLPTLATTAWYHGLIPNKPATVQEYARGGRTVRAHRIRGGARKRLRDSGGRKEGGGGEAGPLHRHDARVLGARRPAREPPAVPAGNEAQRSTDRGPHRLAFHRPLAQSAR